MMRQVFGILFVAVFAVLMTGCKAPGLTKNQVHMRHAEAIQQNSLQFQEDIDSFFLIDRPSRMSRWYVR